ncbi:MAG: SUMF1/EgtB/PvdO family nonheme iron enzyme [Halobacteria archaeon]|nr:SUMF1/EgtB/PvdO family nonheme iron enzyme [Halobacteria archaeon]
MSRVYYIHDANGERRLGERDMPVSVGGAEQDGIVLPGLPDNAVVAHIGLTEGHAFIQPAQTDTPLFHNHEHLAVSKWLKSGDTVEVGESVIHWNVQGDQVNISVHERASEPALVPPVTPPPPNMRTLPDVAPARAPASGHRTLRRVVLGVFVLLLLAVVFVLLATPVAVHITPEPERLSLEGFPPAVSIGGRRLALPGRYTVTAQRAGYHPLQATIVVPAGGFQLFELQLEELPGRVSIELQPDVPFRLFIDDAEVATDANRLAEIPGGDHRLRIETARYLPVEEMLAVAGKGQAQRVTHVLQPAWARARIDSQPPGATVEIDGTALGVTPLETELLQGERQLVLKLEKHQDLPVPLQVLAGVDLAPDTYQLQPADGRLTLSSEPTAASVSVDGIFQGTTPVTLALTAGVEHTLRLTKPGYQRHDRQLQLAAEEEQSLDVQLRPQYGIVFVTARPADAALRVDGRDAGKATQRLQLTTRSHTLEFSKPGYATETVTVTPRTGTSQNVDITLATAEQARRKKQAAVTPAVITSPAGQQLRLVRAQGSFRMGASRREAGRRANESARLVALSRPFYLASREVSNAGYRQFSAQHSSGSAEGVSLNTDSQPVVNVSWDDAARYCNWLSSRAGLPPAYTEINGRLQAAQPLSTGYRLPSEAEWAFVARKHTRQTAQRYPWSGGFPPAALVGNFADASIADTLANTVPDYNDGHRVSAPVGSFAARPAGFYDLGGNVAEWMHDYYAVYPGEADRQVTDPLGPASGEHHVVRDSSWRQGTITELRLSYRDYSRAARPDLGFRIARYAE